MWKRLNMRAGGTSLLLILYAALACLGAEVPRPMPGTSVHDFAGVIPDDKEAEIQAKARRLKEEYKTEIAVVTIDSLQGEESFDYSMRMARSWGIGSKDNEIRGLLILVSVKDRKTAFRTSRHIEGELPDSVTGGISREMNAHFKKGDFGGGLSLGMEMILERLKEVYEPGPTAPRASQSGSGLGWTWLPIVAVPALGLGYVALRRRRKRRGEEVARQAATGSGFRKWASTVDPSGAPRVAHKNRGRGETTRRPQPSKKKSPSSSTYSPPSYGSGSSDYNSSSSSYDAGSSSGSDSGYSGGSDFGGGGSDSSW